VVGHRQRLDQRLSRGNPRAACLVRSGANSWQLRRADGDRSVPGARIVLSGLGAGEPVTIPAAPAALRGELAAPRYAAGAAVVRPTTHP
jgi:hypothetical protein